MKRAFLSFIIAIAAFITTGAQTEERFTYTQMWSFDTLKLDSMYRSWEERVEASPKDEQAWRNLFEIYNARKVITPMEQQDAYRRACNVMQRMEQAIPESYTFYCSAYQGGYEYEKYRGKPYGIAEYVAFRNQFADRAIELLPEDAQADDYELWASYLMREAGEDSTQLTRLLTRYFDSGLYPAEELQYHFNELQGMDKGAIYIGATEGDLIGKLILQLVLHVHRDKLLYNDNCASYRPYLEAFFQSAGLSQDYFGPEGEWAKAKEQFEEQRLNIRHICQHAQRPVYFSASSLSRMIVGEGLPDDLKACLYNEGLTMRYSAKPYDNLAAKRRNVEERYRLEYLRLSFRPSEERDDTRRFRQSTNFLAFNYLLLLNDLMPYYKAHSPGRYAWLNSLFNDILSQLRRQGLGGLGGFGSVYIIKEITDGGLHYEVIDDPTRFDAFSRKANNIPGDAVPRVLFRTEPVTTTNYSNYTNIK
ncbi:MAG: hypothetical protein J6W75_04840 [Bacteroidaceae bacterium]|nr:hypothetical protein [Bacteroidaceae bacterium]